MTTESSMMTSAAMPTTATKTASVAKDFCTEAVASYACAGITALGIIAIFAGMFF